jgi:hypothetical protein
VAENNQRLDHIRVLNSNKEIVSSFAVYTEPLFTVSRFTTWNGHWILSARDFLIQDGEIVNKKLGMVEIFNWGIVKEKPVYLFHKGPRIGISYDGKILPLAYQDVAHYKCCEFEVNNPSIDHNSIHFFGERNGTWYYVVVEIKRFTALARRDTIPAQIAPLHPWKHNQLPRTVPGAGQFSKPTYFILTCSMKRVTSFSACSLV